MRRSLLVVWTLAAACNLDSDLPAPFVPAPTAAGACGTTESLFPKLLAFVRADRFRGLREVIERRLLPTAEEPAPDPSFRTLLGALVRLVRQLGLDKTAIVAELVEQGELEETFAPFLTTVLEFMDGRLDGKKHYEAADATALFVRRCNPDHLLGAVEGVLRLKSPSHAMEPWVVAVLREATPLLEDPELQPFLDGFERESARGRPAIMSLLTQIMIFLADSDFAVDRVRTLLESAVYPSVSEGLRLRVESLLALLEEATDPRAGILRELQSALRCGLMYELQKDAILGLLYDLVATEEVGLVNILRATEGLLGSGAVVGQLELLADVVHIVRSDLVIRDDLRELLAVLLTTPDVELSVPVFIDLLGAEVVSELVLAVAQLLGGCEAR